MNSAKLAAALNTISVAFGELAEALIEAAHSPAGSGPSLAVVPSDDFPPFEPQDAPTEPVYEALPLPATAPGLGRCPSHALPWVVKPAGVSRATGLAFTAFWKCDGKTDGTYCPKKPVKSWADAHPLT